MAADRHPKPESRSFLRTKPEKGLLWERGSLKIRGTDARDLAARMLARGLVRPPGWKSPQQIEIDRQNEETYRLYRRHYQTGVMARLRAQRKRLLASGRMVPRKLLRQRETGLWLTQSGFSQEIEQTVQFRSFDSALAHCAKAKLSGLEIVVTFVDQRYDQTFPLVVQWD